MGERFAGKAEVEHRRTSLWLATFLTMTGMLPHDLVSWTLGSSRAVTALGLVGLIAMLAWFRNAWTVRRRGRLEADATGLSIAGERLVTRDAIASAYVLGGSKPTARIVRKRFHGFPLDVHVGSDDEARAVVDALGLGVSSSTAVFDVELGSARTAVLFVLAAAALGMAAVALLPDALASAGPALLAALFLPAMLLARSQVHVGTDGLLVTRVGSKTFIPFGEIERIDAEGREGRLVVHRRGGPPVRLRGVGKSTVERDAPAALLRRIEEARAAYARGESGASAAVQLERGGRTTGEWIANLRRLVEGNRYREAAALPDQLYRIVEDPSEPEATRAGAAVALGPVLDADGRARLRVAAEASASPKLRVALERASEEDAELEALEEALTSLEQEAPCVSATESSR